MFMRFLTSLTGKFIYIHLVHLNFPIAMRGQ